MGNLVSFKPPSEDSEFAKVIVDVNRMDRLYVEILDAAAQENPDIREIRVDHFMKYMKKRNDAIFNQVAADTRIVIEGYSHVMKTIEQQEEEQEEDKDIGFPEMKHSQSAPSFKRAKSSKKASLKHLNSEQGLGNEELSLTKEEFRIFLPTIYLFSMLWEVFIAADTSISNYLVNEGEYMRAFKRMSAMPGVIFSDLLTRERWNKEFQIIDSNSSGTITFQELCNYTVKKVIAPMAYLKVVQSTFFFYDMDDDTGPNGGGLPAGNTRDVPVSDYADSFRPDGGDDDTPVDLTPELFQWGTRNPETRCHVTKSRMVRKNGRRVVEFEAQINEGENELDVTLYGTKTFRFKLPNGIVATQGDFTLYPPEHLASKPAYLTRDDKTKALIAKGVSAVLSTKADPRTATGELKFSDHTVSICNGIFKVPFADIPNGVYTVNISAANYYPPEEFMFMKFDLYTAGENVNIDLKPKFHRCDLGDVCAWDKRTISPPSEEVCALTEDVANLPKQLTAVVRFGSGSGPYTGQRDSRCIINAIAMNKNGKAVIEVEPKLPDDIDALDISLYGKKDFELRHPDNKQRVVQGSLTFLPQQNLLPRAMYTISDNSTGETVSESGTALISAERDPRTLDDQEIIPAPGQEAMFVNGVLAFPVHNLPDGVLTITAKNVAGYVDGGDITLVKFQQHVVQGASDTIYLEPKPPVYDLSDLMTGQTIDVTAIDYAAKILRTGVLPRKLNSEVFLSVEGNAQADPRCELEVEAVSMGGKPTLHIQAKVKSDVEEMDFTLYGWKTFTITTPSGQVVATGKYKLVPQASCLPRGKYNLRDCTNNQPYTGAGVVTVSACKDQRAIAGEYIMDDLELPIVNSSFTLPLDDLPNAVLCITPKADGYVATEFTTVKFGGHINRGEQTLFLNPVMAEPGQCRVTLAWGQAPRDLDIHVKTSDGQHVSYSNRATRNSSVKLDIDVQSGYGPETLTFKPDGGIRYRIYVQNYSRDIELYKSEAVIFFSTFDRTHDFHLRISQDSHGPDFIYWDCFEMDDNGIPHMINRVVRDQPNA